MGGVNGKSTLAQPSSYPTYGRGNENWRASRALHCYRSYTVRGWRAELLDPVEVHSVEFLSFFSKRSVEDFGT